MSKRNRKTGVWQADIERSMKNTPTKIVVDQVVELNLNITKFWKDVEGWAPMEAVELLSKSRLDRQVSLSRTLKLWLSPSAEKADDYNLDSDGRLILGWANLGSLIEGTMKWFLSVFYKDYMNDPHAIRKNDRLTDPDVLSLEPLRVFFNRAIWMTHNDRTHPVCPWSQPVCNLDDWINWDDWIAHVQQRRNAIHAFKNRELGTLDELERYIHGYNIFLNELNSRVPYPDSYNHHNWIG